MNRERTRGSALSVFCVTGGCGRGITRDATGMTRNCCRSAVIILALIATGGSPGNRTKTGLNRDDAMRNRKPNRERRYHESKELETV